MRISEQIDALEIMGVPTETYLVMPRVIASVIVVPIMVIIAASAGVFGAWIAANFTGYGSQEEFVRLRGLFDPFDVQIMLIKSFSFGFLLFLPYPVSRVLCKGGALEIGKASTQAVVLSCIYVLLADYVIAGGIVMIEISHIHKVFNGVTVLNDVSAVFESGKTNLIIGISGSGKTVLMKCIVGLLQPDSGQVLFNKESFHEMPPERRKEVRRQIGMLFQERHYLILLRLRKM